MRWVTWRAVLLALSLAPCVVFAADNPNEVPFKLYRGYAIVVRGSVGNLKNLNFLIDTGAVPSVLDERIAQKLHLTGATERLSVFTQKVETVRAVAPNVQLGSMRAEALPVVVRDLSFATDALGTRVDAMIGFDFLGQGPFTIDYESKKIVFGTLDSSLTAVPYEAHPGYAVVELKVQQQSLRLLVDTGASDLVLFASATRDCQDAIKSIGTRTWSNMGGAMRVEQVQLKDANLGATSWSTHDVFILPDGGNPPAGLRGLLGVASLKARRVGFDPDQQIIAWDRESGGSSRLARINKEGKAGPPRSARGCAQPVHQQVQSRQRTLVMASDSPFVCKIALRREHSNVPLSLPFIRTSFSSALFARHHDLT